MPNIKGEPKEVIHEKSFFCFFAGDHDLVDLDFRYKGIPRRMRSPLPMQRSDLDGAPRYRTHAA